ncbi:SIR2 family NAD-dependent protein deacylase [Desulfurispira natronophila]|uniref:protein acetyllysine N-acetyltransferase n=1 Tax=Desulfurispira natronophila TaxID=682562 RepID=A0A7W7Y5X9_9BACT|nr:NAD-dependent protein deacylase [Desulfurispira natronophila]MBB5022705.1 NAD-dependent deacetylase [Desulfurispira natronophila]
MTMAPQTKQHIEAVAGHIRDSSRILFITGAGISADSGLPTYRGVGGLYNDNETEDGIPIEQALAGAVLESRPEVTWKYLMRIEEAGRNATYNAAHQILARIEDNKPDTWIFTQNVDGFHSSAGSRNVVELHGNMHHLRCMDCTFHEKVIDYQHLQTIPPRCPQCTNGILRPGVVFFGEMLPMEAIMTMREQERLGFDLVISIGTSNLFPYISEPVIKARRQGKKTAEINPAHTSLSHLVDHHIPLGAAEAMEAIWEAL